MTSVQNEPEASVRHKIADTTGEIAAMILEDGEWPEMLPFLIASAKNPAYQLRESSMIIFSRLTFVVGDKLLSAMPQIKEMMLGTLADPERKEVRLAALNATASLVQALNETKNSSLTSLADVIPHMVQVMSPVPLSSHAVSLNLVLPPAHSHSRTRTRMHTLCVSLCQALYPSLSLDHSSYLSLSLSSLPLLHFPRLFLTFPNTPLSPPLLHAPPSLSCLSPQVLTAALNEKDEETARSALEEFISVAEEVPKFFRRHMDPLVQFSIQIVTAAQLEDETRFLAVELLVTMAEQAPAMMRKQPTFLHNMVPLALQLMLTVDEVDLAEWNATTDDDDDTDMTSLDVGKDCLDRLALSLGGNTVFKLAFRQDLIPAFLEHPEWKYRHAALCCISQVAEGCKKQMVENMEAIVDQLIARFVDPHPRVRWAAINAMGQLETDLGPELQNMHHGKVGLTCLCAHCCVSFLVRIFACLHWLVCMFLQMPPKPPH